MYKGKIRKKLERAISDKKNIVVEIYRGCLEDIHNLPDGYTYELIDWDFLEEEG